MCGIAFAARTSASFGSTGASIEPTSPGSVGSHPSPASSSVSSSNQSQSPSVWDEPGFGIPLPDGSRAPQLDANETWQQVVDSVRPRGPDFSNSLIQKALVNKKYYFELRFHASVLHMRGDQITPQPFVSPDGDVLIFNGEIFDGLNVEPHENDGQKLFDLLLKEGPSNFFAAIRNIEGPYAFVYYQASNNRIYFARDPLGRRSLLMHPPVPSSPYLILSSNGLPSSHQLNRWEDVPCDAIHCYHLRDLKGRSWLVDGKRGLSSYPRYPKSMGLSQDILIYPFDPITTALPSPAQLSRKDPRTGRPVPSAELQMAVQSLAKELEASIRKRVTTIPRRLPLPAARVAVLFSGGIDCTTMALLIDKYVPSGEAIDLINVAFENPRKLAAAASLSANAKGKQKASEQTNSTPDSMDVDSLATSLATPSTDGGDVEPVDLDATPLVSPNQGKPPPDWPGATTSEDLTKYEVPDRITGRASLAELRRLRPQRTWNFVEANVSYEEMMSERQRVIDLMRPNQTVMDLSIAIAFFFAARGRGIVTDAASGLKVPYESPARVVMSGLGADELLGGYARHRRAFKRHPSLDTRNQPAGASPSNAMSPADASVPSGPVENWLGLINEMQMDIDRLPARNLGRDDRIVSYHGKEARYPYLAANVVDFCARTPIWLKCDMRFDEGVGDKLVLRLLAARLGLTNASTLKKRAIHFGARTAKMELNSGKDKGEAIVE